MLIVLLTCLKDVGGQDCRKSKQPWFLFVEYRFFVRSEKTEGCHEEKPEGRVLVLAVRQPRHTFAW